MNPTKTYFWDFQNWGTSIPLGRSKATIKKILLIGYITNMANLSKNLFIVRSTAGSIDYSRHFRITYISGTLVQIESDFEVDMKTEMFVQLLTNPAFNTIITGFIQYELEETAENVLEITTTANV